MKDLTKFMNESIDAGDGLIWITKQTKHAFSTFYSANDTSVGVYEYNNLSDLEDELPEIMEDEEAVALLKKSLKKRGDVVDLGDWLITMLY